MELQFEKITLMSRVSGTANKLELISCKLLTVFIIHQSLHKPFHQRYIFIYVIDS